MMKGFVGGNEKQLEEWKARGWNMMDPEDVARVVVWLLSEDARSVFGANINVGCPLP